MIYYFFVVVIFFRKDILKILKEGFPKKPFKQNQQNEQASIAEDNEKVLNESSKNKEDSNEMLFSSVHDLMEELKISIHHLGRIGAVKVYQVQCG